MRKDGECTFGVLEARFRVLTSRIYRRKADVEKMFKVCCCLHNMIVLAAAEVRARMAGVNLSDTLNKCSLDDGEDLRDTNARGDIVRNLDAPTVDDGGDGDIFMQFAHPLSNYKLCFATLPMSACTQEISPAGDPSCLW